METDDQKIAKLKPDFQPIVKEILKRLRRLGWQPKVAEGLRTLAQQQDKVKRGYSQTLNSYHLTGYAVDIIDARYAWNIPQNHRFWYDLGITTLDLAKTEPALGWGGLWSRGKVDTTKESSRLAAYTRAVTEGKLGLITWFADVAHVEMRK